VVDKRHSSLTIGREDGNDVVVARKRVSRRHARIEVSHNRFVLTDQSANGTFVQSDGEDSFIRRGSLRLKRQGMIGLGSRSKQGAPHTIRFTSEEI
jgi:adenylate cyclase